MPLLWLSLAFILGLLAADWTGWAWAVWLGLLAAALVLWPFLRRARPDWLARLGRRSPRLKLAPILLAAAFAAGGLRLAAAQPTLGPTDLAYYNGSGPAVLRGWVAADPDVRDRVTLLRVEVESLGLEGRAVQPVRGAALVSLAGAGGFGYGERVELVGSPAQPPAAGDFSYRDYLARKGVYTLLTNPGVRTLAGQAGSPFLRQIYRLRSAALRVVAQIFPAPESQLLAGILLGVDSGMPAALSAAYQSTGTAHIIAISGFNMAVLSGLFLSLFGRLLTRGWAALAAVLVLLGYSLLVGAGASVVRAAIMCALAISAAQIGRSTGALNALLLSAGLMCLFDPNLPWDVSFQLTFAATFGLMLYAGPLQGWFARFAARRLPAWAADRLVGPVGEYLLCTLAAQLTTLPVIVWHFGRLSLISLLANPLALPPQAPLMVLAGLAVAAGLVWLPLGQLLALFAWPLAAYTNRLVAALAHAPAAELVLGPLGQLAVMLVCAGVMLAAIFRARLAAHWSAVRPVLVLLAVGGLAAFTWRAALANPDGQLHLLVLDVAGGPAVILRAPDGATLLIGGGQNASELELALGRRLPPLGARLDGLVLTGPRGLEGLLGVQSVFRPGQAYRCAALPAVGAGGRLGDALARADVDWMLLDPQRGLNLGRGARLAVVQQTASDCALRLEFGQLRLILPGALEPVGPAVRGDYVAGAAAPLTWRAAGWQVLAPPPDGWLELRSDGAVLWLEQGRDRP